MLIYLQKELDSYLVWFFYNRSLNLQRNLKEIKKKGNNSVTKQVGLRRADQIDNTQAIRKQL